MQPRGYPRCRIGIGALHADVSREYGPTSARPGISDQPCLRTLVSNLPEYLREIPDRRNRKPQRGSSDPAAVRNAVPPCATSPAGVRPRKPLTAKFIDVSLNLTLRHCHPSGGTVHDSGMVHDSRLQSRSVGLRATG